MDDKDLIWSEIRAVESRIMARLERLAADNAIRHADNVIRLVKLEEFYWQSVGAGRVAKATWAVLAAIGTSMIWLFKGYFFTK